MALSRVWKYRGYWKNACKRKRKKRRKILNRGRICELWTSRSASRERMTTCASWKLILFHQAISLFRGVDVRLENSDVSPQVLVILSTLVKFYTLRLIDDPFVWIAPQTRVTNRPAKKNNKIGIYKIDSDYNEHSFVRLYSFLFAQFYSLSDFAYAIISPAKQTLNKEITRSVNIITILAAMKRGN